MQQVIIVIHLMVVVALVVLILYQKSEGGALGIGGGGGLFTGRGQANAITRATGILGAIFFLTSIALTVLPAWERGSEGVDPGRLELKELPPAGAPAATPNAAAPADKKESIFDQLQRAQQQRQGATPPAAEQPAAPAEAAPATPPAAEGAKEPDVKAPEVKVPEVKAPAGADTAPAEQK
ncbi:preprotein translocase subunit SecG [Methylosinus sp. H3A]|uniref:preprotein translocase subunit SecG n=1 Tax=Methylosinus sp. H3A TaxID=2785786 RepID=UPI0018C273D2|nr:preprotein translocase subunit SecG [Methylosinus sp. H3A]MBG0809206.1 preprotein translocase subunit SecG [Methylosinus sp. H3A]